ncbi:flagellar export chaperone FliS [Shewanella sp. SR43-8]|uniref:flagellar export chaperone FliS n=1 Tax=Shewanella sp. SR43-8 TaxID=2760938 RepID=UPI0016013AD5|nr:flagellar export chaperone FliS [Shewanella sp. SR43-8]MBB1320135.1 flagellar export chaperone FliS [Shewanella sp. SR43-8]|tara:strand:+ start:12663 stop:13067 length:405 start_codon:yes stop_codon:yes gene_type:complete
MRSSLQSYRKVSLDSEISVASPHRIIQMMFAGGLERLAQSRYAIENGDMINKGLFIGKAIGIINGLNNSLNMDEGGEIAGNLSKLYDFIILKVTEANLRNDAQAIDDAVSVLRTLKEGWDAIPQDKHHITSEAS